MKKVMTLIGALMLWSTSAQAALVTFDPLDSIAQLNDIFSVDIVGQGFPDTQGGGLNLFYDETVVNVLSVAIDESVWDFTTGNNTGNINNTSGEVIDILVGAFPGVTTGNFIVATVEFQAVGLGTTDLTLTDSTIANPWGSAGSPINPDYAGVGINPPGTISVQAVPLPAALWLFGSGLTGLVVTAKRRRHT